MSFSVQFLPDLKSLELLEPTPVSDAAALCDLLIDHPCGSRASCGKCRVKYLSGAPEVSGAEARLLSAAQIAEGWRLSCQSVIASNASIEVPALSRAGSAKSFGGEDLFAGGFESNVRLRRVTLPEPDLDYQWALEDSLGKQLDVEAGPWLALEDLRALPALALEDQGRIAAILDGGEALALASGKMQFRTPMGIALDIGSTSLAAAVINLESGAVVAHGSALNPQVRFGGDVISRIGYAQDNEGGNAQLHRVLIDEINQLIARLIRTDAKVDLLQVWSVCAVGNPAMLHTFLGVDVTPLGQAPYVGAWTRGLRLKAAELGLNLRKEATLRIVPMIRSNVGADTVAAAMAAGVDQSDELTLMIDLGTNCEVILGNRDRIIATSTAAGPAFEGANIRQGMRAAPGAIDRVSLQPNGRLAVRVLGNVAAKGICGSGLIDAASALLRTGLLDASGRLHGRDALDERQFPELAARVVTGEHGHAAVILARREDSEHDVPVMLTALDIRQLQLIKGSILAGAKILMQTWGARPEDLGRVLIAGAFGSYVRKSSALDIGLVPAIDPERVEFIGNAAGTGARMALVDRNAWERAERIRERAEYVELGGHADYQDAFGEAMGFHDSPALKG